MILPSRKLCCSSFFGICLAFSLSCFASLRLLAQLDWTCCTFPCEIVAGEHNQAHAAACCVLPFVLVLMFIRSRQWTCLLQSMIDWVIMLGKFFFPWSLGIILSFSRIPRYFWCIRQQELRPINWHHYPWTPLPTWTLSRRYYQLSNWSCRTRDMMESITQVAMWSMSYECKFHIIPPAPADGADLKYDDTILFV